MARQMICSRCIHSMDLASENMDAMQPQDSAPFSLNFSLS